jgi:hemerythrin-like domain-containing protein
MAVAAVIRGLQQMLDRGPADEPERYFDVLRAMLFYIDEFPERLHHPKESDFLFPKIARRAPEMLPVIQRLEEEHMQGEGRIRALQHLLQAWELLGDGRRSAFETEAQAYVRFYLDHMRREEQDLLPRAEQVLTPQDWAEVAEGFRTQEMPLQSGGDPHLDRLFTRIVLRAPAPIGVG